MGVTFNPTASASAPNVEAGLVDAWFMGADLVAHPDWAGPGKFGKPDDGQRFHFGFLLSDPESPAEPLYDDGEPVSLEKVTGTNLNPTSKTVPAGVQVLKGLLSPQEFAAFQAGQAPNSDALIGRPVQLVLSIKENGWPNIDSVMPGRKGMKPRTVAKAA